MDWMDPISMWFLFALTLVFLWKTSNFWNSSRLKLPPGPRPLPLIGNLYLMDLKKPHITMLKFSKQYGPVFCLQMGLQKIVVLTGYETVKEALVNQADWKVMRRFAITMLRDYGMGKKTIEDRIVEECHFLIQKFESFNGKPFETTTIMNAAVANIVESILLGKRYEYEDPMFIRLLNIANENTRLVGSPSVQLYKMFPALGFLFGTRKTVLDNRKELFDFVQATFIEHLKELDVNDQRGFIDAFLIRQQDVT